MNQKLKMSRHAEIVPRVCSRCVIVDGHPSRTKPQSKATSQNFTVNNTLPYDG
jgi:hypothetical protein